MSGVLESLRNNSCPDHGYKLYDGKCAIRDCKSNMSDKSSFLLPGFIEAMNDIGRYGHEKYGEFSFHHRAAIGDNTRGDHPRTKPEAIAEHAASHFQMHIDGIPHDHFGTRKHQLAAVAFNALMEYYFSGLDDEITPDISRHTGTQNQ